MSGISGAGMVILGIGVPLVLPETLPDVARWALVGLGAALVLISVICSLINKGGDGAGQSARTAGDGSHAMNAGRDFNYYATPPADRKAGGPIVRPLNPMEATVIEHRAKRPVRDLTSLTNGLLYASFGSWNRTTDDMGPEDATLFLGIAVKEFQQLSADEHLVIRGRPDKRYGVHKIIPPEVWGEQQVERLSMIGGKPKTEYLPNARKEHPIFYQLVVSKAEVEDLFRDRFGKDQEDE
jgi:hypothetical protein